jgi:hypothetical protein
MVVAAASARCTRGLLTKLARHLCATEADLETDL